MQKIDFFSGRKWNHLFISHADQILDFLQCFKMWNIHRKLEIFISNDDALLNYYGELR